MFQIFDRHFSALKANSLWESRRTNSMGFTWHL